MNVRDQLLSAAARVYAEAGYRGATTRRIADDAGVNEITLFRHFGSKDALIREALAHAGSRIEPPALPDNPSDPRAELMSWAGRQLEELRERRSLIRMCMGESGSHPGMMTGEGCGPVAAARGLCCYLRRLREAGLARAPFDEMTAAAMLMSVLFADAMGRDIMPDLYANRPEDALDGYVQLFLRAIGTDTTSAPVSA